MSMFLCAVTPVKKQLYMNLHLIVYNYFNLSALNFCLKVFPTYYFICCRAVVDHSVGKDLPSVAVESFESVPGRGLMATLNRNEVMFLVLASSSFLMLIYFHSVANIFLYFIDMTLYLAL